MNIPKESPKEWDMNDEACNFSTAGGEAFNVYWGNYGPVMPQWKACRQHTPVGVYYESSVVEISVKITVE